MATTFHYRINGGKEETVTLRSGVYLYAVAALPAMLDITPPVDVEIWVPSLLPEYGPYNYRIEYDGGVHVWNLIKRPG